MTAQVDARYGRFGYAAVFVFCSAIAVSWLAVGATAGVLHYWPGLLDRLAASGSTTVLAAADATGPLAQLLLDDGLSLVGIGVAVALVVTGTRSWAIRLLALALVGSAATFNLQSDAVAVALEETTGIPLSAMRAILLHVLTCSAFILALVIFPTSTPTAWWQVRASTPRRRTVLVAIPGLLVVGTGIAATQLSCALSCVLSLGFAIPAAGIVAMRWMVRNGPSHAQRTQARLLFAVLVAALTANTVLGLSTLALWSLGAPGLALANAESGEEPIAPLFWSARIAAIVIAVVVLLSVLITRLWGAERVTARALAAVLTVVVVGGAAVGAQAVGWALQLGEGPASLLAAATAGVLFLPVHLSAEGLTDRMLYGVRPTPYRALAEIATAVQASVHAEHDLDNVARAVGQALGAEHCHITVVRYSLPDRTYRWPAADSEVAPPMVSAPIRYGEEQIGTLAVEHAAVGGLHADRRQLLEDIADGLGGVVAAHRIGVELERQLRAAVAHSAEIAQSRRRAVFEMDAERRRIERDLHDGVQHHLVSLRLALGIVEFEVDSGKMDSAVERLTTLGDRLDTAEAVLAETVGGVPSIVLVERGLVAALESGQAETNPVSVVSELPSTRRYPPEIESTVYLCCLEAMNNAAKHAPGASVVARLSESEGSLRFTVTDDGPGFNPGSQPGARTGRGLRNLRQRIVGAGGWFDIRSAPGQGTTVAGAVPVPTLVDASPLAEARAPSHTSGPTTTHLRIVGPHTAPDLSGVSIVAPFDVPAPRGNEPVAEELTTQFSDARVLDDDQTHHLGWWPAGARPEPVVPTRKVPGTTSARELSLVAEIGMLLAAARADLGPTFAPGLATVEASMSRPFRLGFIGADTAEVERFARSVLPVGAPPGIEFTVAAVANADAMDAIVVVDDGRPRHAALPTGLPTIVVVDEERAGPGPKPAVVSPLAVVRIGCRIACVSTRLTDADFIALRAGRPVPLLGSVGNRIAHTSAREARTLAGLKIELVRRSGVPALREALYRWVFARADILRGRRAVARLLTIVPEMPPGDAVERLRYGLERIQVARPEFAEDALLDDLRNGDTGLAGSDRSAALRLLGAGGPTTTDRLGLSAVATERDLVFAAYTELARWQWIATTPGGAKRRQNAAAVLVRTCERLLTRSRPELSARPEDTPTVRH